MLFTHFSTSNTNGMKKTDSYVYFLFTVSYLLFINDLIVDGVIDVTWLDFFLSILASAIITAITRYASKYQPEE